MATRSTDSTNAPRTRPGKGSHFDLVIVGGGSAAFAAAIEADELGARVAIVEREVIGGTCLNQGCVPSKYLIRVAELYQLMRYPPMPGVEAQGVRLDWAAVIEHKRRLLEEGRTVKYWDVLAAHPKVTYLQGDAEFLSQTELRANGSILTAPKCIVATGASPAVPSIEGMEKVRHLTSTEALDLKDLPRSMLVIGANAVGLELAQLFARVGVQVTVHEVAGRIAPYEEPEISGALQQALIEEGLAICTAVLCLPLGKRAAMSSCKRACRMAHPGSSQQRPC